MNQDGKDSKSQENPPEPTIDSESTPGSRGFLTRYSQQITGFIGWYLIATLLSGPSMAGVITTPATLVFLVIFATSKQSKGIAGGILTAVALNFAVSLVRGLSLNAWCLVPFYYNTGF